MFRNPDYFTNVEQFVPERWLGDETYKNDNRGVVRPFSYGPRNCIGRKYDSSYFFPPLLCGMSHRNRLYNLSKHMLTQFISLAYVEMRLTLARLLFNFDIEPTPDIEGWLDQNVFLLWEKKPLLVKLIPRHVKSRQEVIQLAE
jgi:hypothetical protein